MSTAPEIAVVIPTYRRGPRLAGLLQELIDQSLDHQRFEVIVVDDCSPDGSLALVESMVSRLPYRLQVVQTETNRGPAAARNLGWRASTAPLLAFLDDDCTPSLGWLAAGLAALAAQPEAGVIQGRTHAPESLDPRKLTDWYVWRVVEAPTAYFEGCNLFFRRDALMVTGGFDEDIRYYGEDTAAGWRVLEAGFSQGFCSSASVEHPVEQRGFRWFLQNGFQEDRLVHCAAKHPGFRQAGFWRPWAFRREDPALVAALTGVVVAVRFRPALLLALPYLWWQRPSVRHLTFFRLCLQVPAVDAARLAGHLRGSVAHRILVI